MRHAVPKKLKEALPVTTEVPLCSSNSSPANLLLPTSRKSNDLPILISLRELEKNNSREERNSKTDTGTVGLPHKVTGTLYLVSVPIGCAEDISLRALRILRTVSQIICENRGVSKKLLEQLGIEVSLSRYAGQTANGQEAHWLGVLRGGEDVAFLCDAGMPGVADPGRSFVRLALQHNLTVIALPGPTACLTALIASGLPTDRFTFDGFPPHLQAERAAFFQRFAGEERTIILYESARRLRSTLAMLKQVVGPSRPIAIASNLTHPREDWARNALVEVIIHFRRVSPHGEYTLVIAGLPSGSHTKT